MNERFPLTKTQVKSFLAAARPVDPSKRPASAPVGAGGGGGGGDVVGRSHGGSRGLGETRCPSTAGAAVSRAGHGNNQVNYE